MLCRLCLLDCDDLIEIFDEDGSRLKINLIVKQHFGIELRSDDELSSKICTTCWLEIENFHVFFVDIQRAQEKLNLELAKCVDPDPDIDDESDTGEESEAACDSSKDEGIDLSRLEECGLSITSNIDEDMSNVCGDIDVFAAPSTTVRDLSQTIKDRKFNRINKRRTLIETKRGKQDVVVVDIETPEYNNDENLRNPMDFCAVDYDSSSVNQHEGSTSNLNGYAIPDLRRILQRNEISITPLPDISTEPNKECDDKINKYMQLKCDLCKENFVIFSELKKHFRDVHNINGYVECCNIKLYKQVQLLDHIMKHINSDVYRLAKGHLKKPGFEKTIIKMCQLCRKVFKSKKQYEHHLWEHQNGKSTRVQCKQCGLWFKHRYSLQKHIRYHIDQNNDHICALCGKKTLSDVALHRHLKNVHYKERKYQCTHCEKAFKWSINLKEHMAIHTGESLYTCPYCPKTFNASSNLHSHRKKAHRMEWEEERKKRTTETAVNDKTSLE